MIKLNTYPQINSNSLEQTMNNINNEDITFDKILKSKNELYHEKQENVTYKEYVMEFINHHNYLFENYNQKDEEIINNHINGLINYYNKCSFEDKKNIYTLVKNEFVKILDNDNAEILVNLLTNENRKYFEQIIVSDTVEEYELLKKVTVNNHSIKGIVKEENDYNKNNLEVIDLNNKLLSSKSWKFTKFLRIKEKIKI